MSNFNYFGKTKKPKDARRIIIQNKGYGPNWYKQRAKALKRDDYTCQKCGYRSKKNHCHHKRKIKYFASTATGEVDYEAANNLDNLMTVCKVCHPILDGHKKFDNFITFK